MAQAVSRVAPYQRFSRLGTEVAQILLNLMRQAAAKCKRLRKPHRARLERLIDLFRHCRRPLDCPI